jgi:hypothetical protein
VISIDEIFSRKIQAAAIAGWWTLYIAYCILLIQWFAYLIIIPDSRQVCFASEVKELPGRKSAPYGCGQ